MQPVGRDNRAGDREGGGTDPGCHLAVDVEDVESAGDAHDLEPSPSTSSRAPSVSSVGDGVR